MTRAPRPPAILQIHREKVIPGCEAAYDAIEADTARVCARLGCPHPYFGIESLTGPMTAWFFNGYESQNEIEQVAERYRANDALMAALQENSRRKAELTREPDGLFATYRPDISRGPLWTPGAGLFLVITVTKSSRPIGGTVFETADGTRFIIWPAATRDEAETIAATAPSGSHVYAVRSSWSFAGYAAETTRQEWVP